MSRRPRRWRRIPRRCWRSWWCGKRRREGGKEGGAAIGFNNHWVQEYKDMEANEPETQEVAAYTKTVLEKLVVR